MIKVLAQLNDIGNALSLIGKKDEEKAVTNIMAKIATLKEAQYQGIQGYWIKNERCWSNCYRQKRASSPKKPTQEVWSECYKEYIDSFNKDESPWEKYAGKNSSMVKTASLDKNTTELQKRSFDIRVSKKTKAGMPLGKAVLETLEEKQIQKMSKILDLAEGIAKVAESLKESGNDHLSKKLAETSLELIKEAGAWDALTGIGQAVRGIGRGISKGIGTAVQKGKQFYAGNGVYSAIKSIIQEANNIMEYLNQEVSRNGNKEADIKIRNMLSKMAAGEETAVYDNMKKRWDEAAKRKANKPSLTQKAKGALNTIDNKTKDMANYMSSKALWGKPQTDRNGNPLPQNRPTGRGDAGLAGNQPKITGETATMFPHFLGVLNQNIELMRNAISGNWASQEDRTIANAALKFLLPWKTQWAAHSQNQTANSIIGQMTNLTSALTEITSKMPASEYSLPSSQAKNTKPDAPAAETPQEGAGTQPAPVAAPESAAEAPAMTLEQAQSRITELENQLKQFQAEKAQTESKAKKVDSRFTKNLTDEASSYNLRRKKG